MANFDALVVGGGSGGSHAARRLAEAGLKVGLIEHRRAEEVGYHWADSIERYAFERAGVAPPSGDEFAGPIERLNLHTSDLRRVATLSPYDYILTERHPFGQRLLRDAAAAGATLMDRTQVIGPLLEAGRVVGLATSKGHLRAPLVIDASGVARAVVKHLSPTWGLEAEHPHLVACYRETRLAEGPKPGTLDVVVGAHGYSWIVRDRHGSVDIGTGALTNSHRSARDIFEETVQRRRDLQGPVQSRGAGHVPLGRPPRSLVHDGVMVLGDAAFQVLPTSGTGVGSSLIGAQLAAETAVAALQSGRADRAALWGYNVAFFRERGAQLVALDALRRELQALSEPEIAFLIGKGVFPPQSLRMGAHGRWMPPDNLGMVKAFGAAWPRMDLLLRLGMRLQLANSLARLYREYPVSPARGQVERWERSYRTLVSPLV